ncbi:hypothetical protein GJ496_011515 [Pomphorhynchus laevis]|nr:hypothetical protein GJ496_011515 [Pomphorhynchus laevis]
MGVCVAKLKKSHSVRDISENSTYDSPNLYLSISRITTSNTQELYGNYSGDGSALYSTIDSTRPLMNEQESLSIASYPHYTDIIVRESSTYRRLLLARNQGNSSQAAINGYGYNSNQSDSEMYAEINNENRSENCNLPPIQSSNGYAHFSGSSLTSSSTHTGELEL